MKYIDPDGRQVFPVHGTWANIKKDWTKSGMDGVHRGTCAAFNDDMRVGKDFSWKPARNNQDRRVNAANELIAHIKEQRTAAIDAGTIDASEPITVVGHSHGGNVAILAINQMIESGEFEGVQINLLTLNTPVRTDCQLSDKAKQSGVSHVNVYNDKDPVQYIGSLSKGTGEKGKILRTFEGATNIQDTRTGGIFKRHQSNNNYENWVRQLEGEGL